MSPELYSIALGKLGKYKVELKNMKADSASYEYVLDNQFFADLDAPEVQKGKLAVTLQVKKSSSGVFLLNFQTDGKVIVLCDRCLDEMELPVSSTDELKVKLGAEFSDEDDMVIVPEEDGYINVAWFMYEFIALSIPMKHIHAPGQCNKGMVGKLSKHLRRSNEEEDEEDEFDLDLPLDDEADNEPKEIDPRWNELKKILDNK